MIDLILGILALALGALLTLLEYRRCLMMLQQNSYRPERYRRWLAQSGDTTAIPRLLVLVLFFLILYLRDNWHIGIYIAVALWLWTDGHLLAARYKKPLVMTPRARRLLAVMLVIAAAAVAVNILAFHNWLLGSLLALCEAYICSHLVALAARWLLQPWERRANRRYLSDAARRLADMPGLTVVGVTGSYGKTSTKHYLQRILSEHFETLMTPGSFNTTLGVVRTIREHLKPYHQVFIAEMGAKQPGDIREICDLVHPTIGVVTAVGEQHLETFGSVENVQRTKFELVDALPPDGLAVVNNDFPMVASRPVDNVAAVRYGVSPDTGATLTATHIRYTPEGTSFTVRSLGGDAAAPDLELHTRLVGECNVSNLLAAVAVARHLGVPDHKIRYAVESIEPVEHRLSMRRTPGGVTVIDDAFNSNPVGARMALDVLGAMTAGRRIIVTPGMIELGDRQAEANRALGEQIAASADIAIIVGLYNREPILEGIALTRPDDPNVHTADSFSQAQTMLQAMLRPGDTVLYENDLPDTFK